MKMTLSMTEQQHEQLSTHLFTGDGYESIAIVLCGRRQGDESHGLLIRHVHPIPSSSCPERTPENIRWPTDQLPEILNRAVKDNLAVLKIHSHPSGYAHFSKCDDRSDHEFFNFLKSWMDDDLPHVSAIMIPSGKIFARTLNRVGGFKALETVKVSGAEFKFWHSKDLIGVVPEFATRVAQAFDKGTYDILRRLKVGIVGCSGTGSLVVQMLTGNCVGHLVLVDPETVETKNLNRIPQATMEDARNGNLKVDVMARTINAVGMGTIAETYPTDICDPTVVRALASCDVLFGCVDSRDGRHLLNKLATFYLIPYFDIGVALEADGKGGIEQICGSAHYLEPGGSSLLSRGAITLEGIRADALFRSNPKEYTKLLGEGYIKGIIADKPAVMPVNMFYASLAVNDFMARLHPYRLEPNAEFNRQTISLSNGVHEHEEHPEPCPALSKHLGKGDTTPLLEMPVLSHHKEDAVA